MIELRTLPTINAGLNAASALLLVAGYCCIRVGRVRPHLACMGAAFVTSTLFLVSYVIYHVHVHHVAFQRTGWIRPVYFGVLGSHVMLAVVIVPLALTVLYRALRGQFERHRRIARFTLPIWLYVSVTGVLVYWMLYGM